MTVSALSSRMESAPGNAEATNCSGTPAKSIFAIGSCRSSESIFRNACLSSTYCAGLISTVSSDSLELPETIAAPAESERR